MQWSEEPNAGFSTASAEDLYLPVDESPDCPTVSAQDQDPNSLLNRFRQLVQIRTLYDSLNTDGNFDVLYAESGKLPFVYSRGDEAQKILIAINPSNREVHIELSHDQVKGNPEPIDIPNGAVLRQTSTGWYLSLPPVSGAIYHA
jgi:maltose alpha-D-glucosyltransferase/alpha-amylase